MMVACEICKSENQNLYISNDILDGDMARIDNPFGRSPTLDTVLMVEKTIEEHSGEYNRTAIWKILPRKVMWQTYLVVLDYLESINKIAFDRNGKVAYIWNPKLAKKLKNRKEITE
jgi:hypothetical protein